MRKIPDITVHEKATHTRSGLGRTDVAPSVAGDVLTVHQITSPTEGRKKEWHLVTITSTVCRVAEDLVVVVMDGWSWRNWVGGIYAFTPGRLGWKKVNVTDKVVARIAEQTDDPKSSYKAAADTAMDTVLAREAKETAAMERKAGVNAYVNPDDPTTVLRFTASEIRAVKGQRFLSLSSMVRAIRDVRELTARAGGMVSAGRAEA